MRKWITVVTVGVDDFGRSLRFYRDGLGLPARNTFWGGYAGYFEDPDRHLWEVVWNPQLAIEDEA